MDCHDQFRKGLSFSNIASNNRPIFLLTKPNLVLCNLIPEERGEARGSGGAMVLTFEKFCYINILIWENYKLHKN
jgi:hypothetical protein